MGPENPTPQARFLCWVCAIKEFFLVRIPHWNEESPAFLFSGNCQSFIGVHVFFFKKILKKISNLQKSFITNYKLHICNLEPFEGKLSAHCCIAPDYSTVFTTSRDFLLLGPGNGCPFRSGSGCEAAPLSGLASCPRGSLRINRSTCRRHVALSCPDSPSGWTRSSVLPFVTLILKESG